MENPTANRKNASLTSIKDMYFHENRLYELIKNASKKGKTKACILSVLESQTINGFKYKDLIEHPPQNSLLTQLQKNYLAPYTIYSQSVLKNNKHCYEVYIKWTNDKPKCTIL